MEYFTVICAILSSKTKKYNFLKGSPLIDWLVYYTLEIIAAKLTDCLITINGEDYKNAQRLGFKPGKSLYHVNGVGVDVENTIYRQLRAICAKSLIYQDNGLFHTKCFSADVSYIG